MDIDMDSSLSGPSRAAHAFNRDAEEEEQDQKQMIVGQEPRKSREDEESDGNGKMLDSLEMELAFLRCLPFARPIGKHRHFRVIALQKLILDMTGSTVPFAEIWERLEDMYDLEELDGMASASSSLPPSPRSLSPLSFARPVRSHSADSSTWDGPTINESEAGPSTPRKSSGRRKSVAESKDMEKEARGRNGRGRNGRKGKEVAVGQNGTGKDGRARGKAEDEEEGTNDDDDDEEVEEGAEEEEVAEEEKEEDEEEEGNVSSDSLTPPPPTPKGPSLSNQQDNLPSGSNHKGRRKPTVSNENKSNSELLHPPRSRKTRGESIVSTTSESQSLPSTTGESARNRRRARESELPGGGKTTSRQESPSLTRESIFAQRMNIPFPDYSSLSNPSVKVPKEEPEEESTSTRKGKRSQKGGNESTKSTSADVINSRHFEKEFVLPLLRGMLSAASSAEGDKRGSETVEGDWDGLEKFEYDGTSEWNALIESRGRKEFSGESAKAEDEVIQVVSGSGEKQLEPETEVVEDDPMEDAVTPKPEALQVSELQVEKPQVHDGPGAEDGRLDAEEDGMQLDETARLDNQAQEAEQEQQEHQKQQDDDIEGAVPSSQQDELPQSAETSHPRRHLEAEEEEDLKPGIPPDTSRRHIFEIDARSEPRSAGSEHNFRSLTQQAHSRPQEVDVFSSASGSAPNSGFSERFPHTRASYQPVGTQGWYPAHAPPPQRSYEQQPHYDPRGQYPPPMAYGQQQPSYSGLAYRPTDYQEHSPGPQYLSIMSGPSSLVNPDPVANHRLNTPRASSSLAGLLNPRSPTPPPISHYHAAPSPRADQYDPDLDNQSDIGQGPFSRVGSGDLRGSAPSSRYQSMPNPNQSESREISQMYSPVRSAQRDQSQSLPVEESVRFGRAGGGGRLDTQRDMAVRSSMADEDEILENLEPEESEDEGTETRLGGSAAATPIHQREKVEADARALREAPRMAERDQTRPPKSRKTPQSTSPVKRVRRIQSDEPSDEDSTPRGSGATSRRTSRADIDKQQHHWDGEKVPSRSAQNSEQEEETVAGRRARNTQKYSGKESAQRRKKTAGHSVSASHSTNQSPEKRGRLSDREASPVMDADSDEDELALKPAARRRRSSLLDNRHMPQSNQNRDGESSLGPNRPPLVTPARRQAPRSVSRGRDKDRDNEASEANTRDHRGTIRARGDSTDDGERDRGVKSTAKKAKHGKGSGASTPAHSTSGPAGGSTSTPTAERATRSHPSDTVQPMARRSTQKEAQTTTRAGAASGRGGDKAGQRRKK